jgi:FkbM family methyltransferase
MKRKFRSIVNRNIFNKFGYDIVRFRRDEMGKFPLRDMARFLHNDHPLIFDVGANEGQTLQSFHFEFPRGTIHSFEPSPTTFAKLKEQASEFENVHLWNCALGSSPGPGRFLENSSSVMSSFLPLGKLGWGTITKETLVEVKTIDQFCREQAIERIDILKSDTQGFDLEVFKGAEQTIRTNRIGLIFCEIIFSDMYENLPSVSDVYDFLTARDFLLVSFYQFHFQRQLASWTDALFVHQSYIRTST